MAANFDFRKGTGRYHAILLLFHIIETLGYSNRNQLMKILLKLDVPFKESQMKVLIITLEKEGMITIAPPSGPGRARRIEATDKGMFMHHKNKLGLEKFMRVYKIIQMNKTQLLKQ